MFELLISEFEDFEFCRILEPLRWRSWDGLKTCLFLLFSVLPYGSLMSNSD